MRLKSHGETGRRSIRLLALCDAVYVFRMEIAFIVGITDNARATIDDARYGDLHGWSLREIYF